MRRDIKSLPFFILGALVLLGLTTCKPKNETDSSKKVPEQALSALNTCNPETYKYSKDTAKIDSSIYSAVIDIITPKSVRDCIENPTVGYFPISLTSINTLKQKEENCEILPADGHNDPSWFYFAIKPGVKNEKDTITAYFICYEGKKGPNNRCVTTNTLIYFDLGNPKKIITISPKKAKDHIKRFKKYIDKRVRSFDLFYPYGFQLPWCDLLAVGENVGVHGDNRVHCVLVIERNPHYGKDGDKRKFRVSMLIRTFKQEKSTREAEEEGDDDEYYDFVNPCPNSCIP